MFNRKKILVAMSGGVDSSVAALLLKREGYELVGAFMKVWSGANGEDPCWIEDRRDALRVAAMIGIPLLTLDFEREYRQDVAVNLFDEYAAGRTPNPDVRCNATVKFPLLWREARRLGCETIATGHYARVEKETRYRLVRGNDEEKDQSYFLHRLTQDDLSHTVFPVGEMNKSAVREIAREAGFPNTDKQSTRGICFIGKVDLPEFLSERIPPRQGKIITADGRVVGEHKGLASFTIGQRSRIGIGGGEPYYVAAKDVATNTLVVARADDSANEVYEIEVNDVHWIGEPPSPMKRLCARIRYRQALQECSFERSGDSLLVRFAAPQRGVAAGQSVVFYDGETCLGGGIIR